ncbi:MAG TPA: ABC transporter ATP-binding protein [Desulfobacteraceae bacterium]|nr:ABC transporter ATP-binding protein [Desulfobacteraceae bacterium]
MHLLELIGVTKRFGGLVAINKIDMKVNEGEFLGVVGPNGSGKTTLFNLINGVYFPDEGKILFNGKDITRLAPYRRAPLGIGRTFQIPRPFLSATVLENVAVGAMFGRMGSDLNIDGAFEIADQVINRLNFQNLRDKIASNLTPIEKKMMEIARALAMKPLLLLMDEAMAGMHPGSINEMVSFLKQVAVEEKIAVVSMVEHIMRAVVEMAERVVVLHQGSIIVDAPTKDALTDPKVIEVYLGKASEE